MKDCYANHGICTESCPVEQEMKRLKEDQHDRRGQEVEQDMGQSDRLFGTMFAGIAQEANQESRDRCPDIGTDHHTQRDIKTDHPTTQGGQSHHTRPRTRLDGNGNDRPHEDTLPETHLAERKTPCQDIDTFFHIS